VRVLTTAPAVEGKRDIEVLLAHLDFPGLGFVLVIDGEGRTLSWTVADGHQFDEEWFVNDPPTQSITARLIRRVPFAQLERAAAAEIVVDLDFLLSDKAAAELPSGDAAYLAALRARVVKPRGRGRSFDDGHYAAVADKYVKAVRAGHRSPAETVARDPEFNAAPNTVKNWLTEARKRKLLTEAPTAGKPGGSLTKKARQLLHETKGDSK
jgi:hypothetical protein